MVFKWYLVISLYFHATTSVSTYTSYRQSSSSPSAVACNPYRSNPSCYHHLLDTRVPGLHTASSKRSRIGRAAIYCVTIFCLFKISPPLSPAPPPTSLPPKGVLTTSVLYPPRLLYHETEGQPIPKYPSNQPMGRGGGVVTNISDPKRRIPQTTALNNTPKTRTFPPSLPRIRNSCAHFFHT